MTRKGFTLIELILSIVLMGLALPMIGVTMYEGLRRNSDTSVSTRETLMAQSLLEELRSRRFDENSASPWSSTLGPDAGETRLSFDDVDDYHGLSESVPNFSGYTQSADVRYVESSNLNGVATSATHYKRLSVTVSGPTGTAITIVSLKVGTP